MADFTDFRNIFNIDPAVTDEQIEDAIRDAGFSSRGGGFGDKGSQSRIIQTLDAIDKTTMALAEHWAKVDKAASDFAKHIGASKDGLKELRNASLKNVARGNIGFEFNMSADELIEAQQNYSKAIGRSMRLGLDDSKTIAAITSIFGDQSDMYDAFDKMGVTMEGVGDHMGKMYHEAAKSGISLEKYAGNVKQGLAMANTYTFKDGLKGMEAMAKRAAAIRMDMSQVSAFADRFSTVEDAITNSAKLQVLGGHFAKLADPINLLNMSLNGLEDTEKVMENFTNGLATFNKATGEVEISTFNRLRLSEYAKTTGQDPAKVMEVARRQAMKGEIEAQMNSARNVAGFDEDFKELIKNTATFKDGKAGVTINGDFKALTELTAKDQEKLIEETRTESQDIKQIAKDVRSLRDLRSGVEKQYKNVQANTVGRVVGGPAKYLTRAFTESGWVGRTIMGIGVGLETYSVLRKGLSKIASAWSRSGGSTGDAAQTILEGTKNAAKGGKAVGKTGKAAQTIKRAFGTAKTVTKETKLVSKAGQISRLVKAGKGAKVAASGFKAVGKKIPIAGALLSAGFEAFENKEMFADRQTRGKAIGKTAGAGVGAAIGAGLGSLLGPVGTIAGGIAGEWLGKHIGGFIGGTVTKIQNKVRDNAKGKAERAVKDKAASAAIGNLKGDYSAKQMREIQDALKTGELNKKKLSASAIRKLRESGDMEALEALEGKKTRRRKERAEKKEEQAKKKLTTASFEIEKAFFPGFESPVSIIRGKKEDGNSKELNEFRRVRTTRERFEEKTKAFDNPKPQKIDVNINGTLKLKGDKGQAVDVVNEIKRNPKLMQEVAEIVLKQMNTMQHGAYVDQKVNGVTSAGSRV